MANPIDTIYSNVAIVDPETGNPTEFFIKIWQQIINMSLENLSDIDILQPTDGQVLTYSEAEGKWIAS